MRFLRNVTGAPIPNRLEIQAIQNLPGCIAGGKSSTFGVSDDAAAARCLNGFITVVKPMATTALHSSTIHRPFVLACSPLPLIPWLGRSHMTDTLPCHSDLYGVSIMPTTYSRSSARDSPRSLLTSTVMHRSSSLY